MPLVLRWNYTGSHSETVTDSAICQKICNVELDVYKFYNEKKKKRKKEKKKKKKKEKKKKERKRKKNVRKSVLINVSIEITMSVFELTT